MLNPREANAQCLTHILELAGLTINQICPTRISKTSQTCLDIIAIPDTVRCVDYTILSSAASDHFPVMCRILHSGKTPIIPVQKRTFKHVDLSQLKRRLKSIQLTDTNLSSGPDSLLTEWEEQVFKVLDDLAPVRNFPRRRHTLPWITINIKKMISQRNKLARRLKQNPTEESDKHWDELKTLKRNIKSHIRAEAKKFGLEKLQGNDHKAIWKFIKDISFTQSKSKSLIPIEAEDLNAELAKTVTDKNQGLWTIPARCDNEEDFQITELRTGEVRRVLRGVKTGTSQGPDGINSYIIKLGAEEICENITKIFNSSINNGYFPSHWKEANVIPVYKMKGSKSEASNYRPISLLPILARCFEKLVAAQLGNYCNANEIIPKEQFGFRKNSNCEMALLSAIDGWCRAVDKGEYVGALLIDLSKAFDTVDHHRLLNDLLEIGCSSKSISWLNSYLTDRKQRVDLRGHLTKFYTVNQGVPQGSALSPLLFNIYVRDLPRRIKSDTVQFADDVTVSDHDKSVQVVKQRLTDSFMELKLFCESKRLTINSSKTQFIILKSPSKKLLLEDTALVLDNITLQPLLAVKLLGLTIDRHINFAEHINLTVTKCRGLLGLLRRVACSMPRKMLLLMYSALIRTHIEYASAVFAGASGTHLQKFEIVQKIASRIIAGLPRDAHAAPICEELGLTSLTERRTKHTLQLVSACLNGRAHPSVCELFKKGNEAGVQIDYQPRTVIGSRAFSFVGRQVYSSSLMTN